MTTASKYFYQVTKNKTCRDILHPDGTCSQLFVEMLFKGVIASLKFYFPSCVLPILFKVKLWNKQFLLNAFIDYLRCTWAGYWLIIGSVSTFCLNFNIFKKFYFNTFVLVPAAIGSLFLMTLPEKIKYIQGVGIFNMLIETLIRHTSNPMVIHVRQSKSLATLLFMVFSAAIMYGFRISQIKRFWFISLPNVNEKENSKNSSYCAHSQPCKEYLRGEFISTAKIAGLLGILKFFMSQGKRIPENLSNIFEFFFKKLDYRMMGFTVAYSGLFKAINCLLNNHEKQNSIRNCLISGFVCGIAYSLYPKYMVFTFGLTTAIQMLWLSYVKHVADKPNPPPKIVGILNSISWSSLIYVLSISMTFHFRILYPYDTPRFVHQLMALGTYSRSDILAKNLAKLYMGL